MRNQSNGIENAPAERFEDVAFAYYYPYTTDCDVRRERAAALGYDLRNEHELLRDATPKFPGHEHRTYVLGEHDRRTTFDNSDPSVIDQQIAIARRYQLGFNFLLYAGYSGGAPVIEMEKPLRLFTERSSGVPFALTACLNRSRAVLPLPTDASFSEPGRAMDMTPESAHFIIDVCARRYWEHPDYFQVMGRPYLSLCAFHLRGEEQYRAFGRMVDEMRVHSVATYGVNPYLVGLVWEEAYPAVWKGIDVDAFSGYGILPDFADRAHPIQDYTALAEKRCSEWAEIRSQAGAKLFVPPIPVGWDASSRGIPGTPLGDVAGVYPHTPIVRNSSPDAVKRFAIEAMKFTSEHVPREERYQPIFAFNEITEGAALLPFLDPDGVTVRWDYLEALTAARRAVAPLGIR